VLIPRDLCQQLLGTHFFETARLSEGIAIKHPRPSCFTPNGFSSPRSSLIAYIVSHRSIISQSRDYVSLIYISLRLRVLKEIRAEISYLCLLYLCFLLVPASFFFFLYLPTVTESARLRVCLTTREDYASPTNSARDFASIVFHIFLSIVFHLFFCTYPPSPVSRLSCLPR
jgi:hypothetical protein